MPDLSPLITPIMSDHTNETVTIETAGEQGQTVTVQSNSQEITEPKTEEISTTIPQEEVKIDTENNVNTIEQTNTQEKIECQNTGCNDNSSCMIDHKVVCPCPNNPLIQGEPVIEKIECDRCHKILNSKEEIPAHNQKEHIGAPCKFCGNREIIMKKTNEYIDKCYLSKPPQIPYKEELALILDVDEDTISNWANKRIGETDSLEHPEFFGAYKKVNTVQKLFLLKRTTGRFNPTGAIFQLKANHGMIETEKKILAGDKDAEPITIKVVEDKPITHDE